MLRQLESSPLHARVVPFVIFLGLTAMQTSFDGAGPYWFYLLKSAVGAWLIWQLRGVIAEMKWAFSWEAVVVGVGVFAMWVGVDELLNHYDFGFPPQKPGGPGWNPNTQFGEGSAMAWFFVAVRIVGSSLVVPPLEEVFYRSFVYRYFLKEDFLGVPPGRFVWFPFLATQVIFSVTHHELLAAFLCGCAYQWLVIRKQRLGDAMTAHAITNGLLGLWVVWKGAWHFW